MLACASANTSASWGKIAALCGSATPLAAESAKQSAIVFSAEHKTAPLVPDLTSQEILLDRERYTACALRVSNAISESSYVALLSRRRRTAIAAAVATGDSSVTRQMTQVVLGEMHTGADSAAILSLLQEARTDPQGVFARAVRQERAALGNAFAHAESSGAPKPDVVATVAPITHDGGGASLAAADVYDTSLYARMDTLIAQVRALKANRTGMGLDQMCRLDSTYAWFGVGVDSLTTSAVGSLRQFVRAHGYDRQPVRVVVLTGTDRSGSRAYNRSLAQRRADMVVRSLVDDVGLAPEEVSWLVLTPAYPVPAAAADTVLPGPLHGNPYSRFAKVIVLGSGRQCSAE